MKIKKGAQFTLIVLLLGLLLSSCSTTARLEKMERDGWSLLPFLEQHHIPAYESSYPTYYNTGAEWNERTLELIEGAQDYILICTFLGVAHASTEPVWSALAQKMAEGVRVYILIDSSCQLSDDS